jgi:hypothetical protein
VLQGPDNNARGDGSRKECGCLIRKAWEENEIEGNSISGNHRDKLYAIKGGTNNTSGRVSAADVSTPMLPCYGYVMLSEQF